MLAMLAPTHFKRKSINHSLLPPPQSQLFPPLAFRVTERRVDGRHLNAFKTCRLQKAVVQLGRDRPGGTKVGVLIWVYWVHHGD